MMDGLRCVAAAMLVVALGASAGADQVFLKNGRAFEGEITKETQTQIFLTMRVGGTITINRSDIASISKEKSPMAEFSERFRELKQSDAAAFLKLGVWAEGKELRNEAMSCYRQAGAIASPHYVEAMFRSGILARDMQDYRYAATVLRDLSERFRHREAWQALMETEGRLRKERLEYLRVGREKEAIKQYHEAVENYRQALRLSLSEKNPNEDDPGGAEIRRMLLACRQAAALASLDELKEPASLSPCQSCNGSRIEECKNCKGTGKITVDGKIKIDHLKGTKTITPTDIVCPDCKGSGHVRCAACQGFGSDLSAFPRPLQPGLVSIARLAYDATESGLLLQTQNIVAQIRTYGPQLPRMTEPSYGASGAVRSAFPSFPPKEDAFTRELADTWSSLDRDDRRRFLVAFGLELSGWANTRILATSRGGISWPHQPLPANLYSRARQVELDALRVSPELHAGQWLKLVATVEGEGRWSDDIATDFRIAPAAHPDLAVYVWEENARERHRWWAGLLGKEEKYFTELAEKYPYDRLAREVRGLARGERRILYGRVRTRRDLPPYALFEIWAVEPVADPTMVALSDKLQEEVCASFVETPLAEVVGFMSMVARTSIEFDQMPDVRISLEFQKTQMGKALALLGRQIGKTWVPVDGKITFRTTPGKEELDAKKQLIRIAVGE